MVMPAPTSRPSVTKTAKPRSLTALRFSDSSWMTLIARTRALVPLEALHNTASELRMAPKLRPAVGAVTMALSCSSISVATLSGTPTGSESTRRCTSLGSANRP